MRHTLMMAVAVTMLFTACQNQGGGEAAKVDSTAAPAESKQERNKRIVKESMENGILKHDANAVLKDAAANFTDYNDGSWPPASNIDTLKNMITMWMAAMPDYSGENLMYVADGDHVMVYGEYSWTWTGDMMGMKADGKKYKTRDVDIFKLNDEGKIIEHRSVQNMANLKPLPDAK